MPVEAPGDLVGERRSGGFGLTFQGSRGWAKEDYIKQSKRKLIASKTLDGKIGSVYFPNGRIRLTHADGPELEIEDQLDRQQFNIDMEAAGQVYDESGSSDDFDSWLSDQLNEHGDDLHWVDSEVIGPEDAPTDLTAGLTLFEIFVGSDGAVKMIHPSRGQAVQFNTYKQSVAVLRAAINQVAGTDNPDDRNQRFFEFVENRLPDSTLSNSMRTPEQVFD